VLGEIKVFLDLVLQNLVRVLMKLSHYSLGSSVLTAVLLLMGLDLPLLSEIVAVVTIIAIFVVIVMMMLRISGSTSAPTVLETLGAKALVKVVLLSSLRPCTLVMLPLLLDAVALCLRL
jgi:hypothetical protein